MLASDSTVQRVLAFPAFAVLPHQDVDAEETENVFLCINLCNPLTHREGKNVAQIWLHRASTPGIADLDPVVKTGSPPSASYIPRYGSRCYKQRFRQRR